MIQRFSCLAALMGLALFVSAGIAEDKKESAKSEGDEFSAKCPVSGAAAKKEQSAEYKGKEVYFCCEKCKAAFESDNAKFAVKANHQLVHTKQFVQAKCPLSGGNVNKEQSAKVEGVSVVFCCDKCKGAIESASKEDQLTKVFSEDAFKKAFVAAKPEKKADK